MITKFGTYFEDRKKFDLFSSFGNLCEEVSQTNVKVENLFENVFQPTILNSYYSNPEQLVNELWDGLKKFMGRKSSTPDVDTDTKLPLQSMPHSKPYDFRNRPNRVLSRNDMQQQNQAAADTNVARDMHNQSIDRNDLRAQAAQKTMKVRTEIMELVKQLKNHYTARLNDMRDKNISNLASRSDSEHRIDVLNKFTDYMNDAIQRFEPNLDLMKYHKDADFSGVKSGLGKNTMMPQTPQHYGTDANRGAYDKNQPKGDKEREREALAASQFNKANRRIVQ